MARKKGTKVEWTICLWVEEAEKATLMGKAKESGVSIGEYLLAGRRGKPETEEVKRKPDSKEDKPECGHLHGRYGCTKDTCGYGERPASKDKTVIHASDLMRIR